MSTNNVELEEDYSFPNSKWSEDAVKLFDELNEKTCNGDWEKIPKVKSKPHVVTSTGSNMFNHAAFWNKEKDQLKAVVSFGPWSEGARGYVLWL